jgi:glycosyltransferase involved in cell wall biosynthesis
VVDDGSTDCTYDIARTFESTRVKVVTQPNAGVCAARNKALTLAQGDYIQWLDADDLLHPEKIARQIARVGGHQDKSLVLLTAAWGKFFFRTQKARFEPDGLWRDLSPIEWILTKLGENVWMNPTCWLVSRRLTALAGPWDSRLAGSGDDDGEYVCRVVSASTAVLFVPEARAYYRIGTVGSLNWNMERSARSMQSLSLSLMLQVRHLLALEDSERTRRASLRYLHTFLPYFYGMDEGYLVDLRQLARRLGGDLGVPRISWKYYPVERLFGRKVARKVVSNWRAAKLLARKRLDKYLYERSR